MCPEPSPATSSKSMSGTDEVSLERRIVAQLRKAGMDATMPTLPIADREAAKAEHEEKGESE